MKNDTGVFRRLPVEAERQPSGGVHFRVWAPERKRVEVLLASAASQESPASYDLKHDAAGYFSGLILDAAPHMLYRYRLDGSNSCPDPASRFQPDGPHGSSQIMRRKQTRTFPDRPPCCVSEPEKSCPDK